MIELGSDLIQGFYVSKPRPIMLHEVSDSVQRDIETINLINSDELMRPYHPEAGEIVDLCLIRGNRYNSVCIEEDNITLNGRSDICLDMAITIRDGLECTLTLDTVKLKAEKNIPTISLGSGSNVKLVIKGENQLNNRGIYVPHDAALRIEGDEDGSLGINADHEDGYAIGAGSKDACGKITIDTKGRLNITVNGSAITGIGGGSDDGSAPIRLLGGEINLALFGRSCVGIGAVGGAIIEIENCAVDIQANARDAVGIGSFHGSTDISLKRCKLRQTLKGRNLSGIGSQENGTGRIELQNVTVDGKYIGHTVNCIGTRNGSTNCRINQANIALYGEGETVMGIGDMTGSGDVSIDQTHLDIEFKTESSLAYGTKTGAETYGDVDENLRIYT